MSNLTPERRADKRGNIVTRWVRSFKKDKSSIAFPAPSAPPRALNETEVSEATNEKVDRIIRNLYSYEMNSDVVFDDLDRIGENLDTIARYDPELVELIDKSTRIDIDPYRFWKKTLREKWITDSDHESLGHALDYCRAAVTIIPLLDRLASEGKEYLDIAEYAATVDAITRDKLPEPDDDIVSGVAMIAYLKGLKPSNGEWSERENAWVDYDVILEDAKFVAEHREAVEAILPELYTRKVSDRENIEMLLSSPAPAMMEGEL